MFQTTEQNITSAHEKIAECKKEIQKAKRIRKNRQGNIFIILFAHMKYILSVLLVKYVCSSISRNSFFKLPTEYDALAKVIQQHPDRHDTLK